MDAFEEFSLELKAIFPELSEGQMEKFKALEPLYRDWNSKINVISRKDIDFLYPHHILHSLAIAGYLKDRRRDEYDLLAGKKVLDLGTGGGFPGIPLAIMFPDTHFMLCDSVGKKTLVAGEVSSALGLENTTIVNGRAESLSEKFDYVVSRAVASLQDFYPWVKGKFSTRILYLKGGDVVEEIATLMGRYNLKKGSVSTWRICDWVPEGEKGYYDGKLLIDIQSPSLGK